jgi:ABC-type uncharacterized transport system substrate-binding protein
VSCLKIIQGMVVALFGVAAFLFGGAASAQRKKNFSIGSLNTADQFINSFEGFRARMVELGYRGCGFKIAKLKVASFEELEKIAAGIMRKNFAAIFAPVDSLVSNGIDALASYTADYSALGSQGAILADQILRGARPASLPIELPSESKLAINLETAKNIDLRIAKELLLRADDVID